MTVRRPRAELLPNANNPRLLMRLLHLVSRGIRSPRALAEILEVELRTVHYYTQAAEWLGLLCGSEHIQLTELGLSIAFADVDDRLKLYGVAVWGNAFVQQLLGDRSQLPGPEALTAFILQWEPQLSESTARRRASAVRALIEPALPHRPPTPTPDQPSQAHLPFAPTEPPQPAPITTSLVAGREENPDVYAIVLQALLDAGELSTAQIRALLDACGGRDCSLGGSIELAMRRGDGHRIDDRIVASAGAIRRRELSRDGVLVALSDPLYRKHLSLVSWDARDPVGERSRLTRRFALWDRRLFGAHPLTPEVLSEKLPALLVGRPLDSVPIAGPALEPFSPPARPFIDTLDTSGLLIAFPASVVQISAGVGKLNPLLRAVQQRPAAVRLPNILDERIACHGGLLYPGERPPRALADNRSVRLRALTHCPVYALLAALLLHDRRQTTPLLLRRRGDSADVVWRGQVLGAPLSVLTAFAGAQGWRVCRPPDDSSLALTDRALLAAAQAAGITQHAGERLILHEALFALLQEDLEARLSYEPLLPLEDRIATWLDRLPVQEG